MKDSRHEVRDDNEQIPDARAGATVDTIMEGSQQGGKREEPQLFSFGDVEEKYNHNNEDEGNETDREGDDDDDEEDQAR